LRGLREKAAAFEALVGHFPDIYFRLSERGVILDYRAHASSELYASPEAFLGRRMTEVLPPEPATVIETALRAAVETGSITTVEYALPMPVGEQWYEARLLSTRDREVACFIRNITSAVHVRQDHERTVALLRATLDATADAMLAVDREGRIETFNANFSRLWNLPEEVLATRDDDAAIAFVLGQLTDPDAFLTRVHELYADPDAESLDELAFRDGRLVERSSRPMRGSGRSGGRVWSFRDVTEARRFHEERDRLLAEAQAAVRARDEFLSIASHELRTPLTSIRLALQNLRKLVCAAGSRIAKPETVETLLTTGERQTRALARLIEELLSVSRIQAGRLVLEREPVSLVEVVREVMHTLQEDVARAGVEVSLTFPDQPVEGHWDRSRIEQIVTNLVTNALRYGDGTPVEIRVGVDGGQAQLEVSDRGPGMEADMQRRIFERFTRGFPATHHGGLGLGLYIVRQIARAHDGDATVRSQPGQGATFTITLPVARTPPLEA